MFALLPSCTKTDSDVDPECTEEETDKYEGPAYCGILVDPFGPFAACHYKIDPMSFFNDCVYDMCELDGSKTELCDALEAYVNECQQRNITIDSWRNSTFCPLTCPPNSHYEPCTSACPATCLNPTPPSCDLPCVEGCQCDKGFVLSGDQCVPKKQCGCFYNGTEYQPGEVIWSKACDQVCKCQSSNNIECKDTSCDPDEYCGSEGGVQGCYPKGSSTCTASGDPHYTSFDKKKFNFHGNCTYVMSQTCNSTQTPFAVYASNEHRNKKKTVTYVKAVYVEVYGITVSILKKKVVQVNGKTVTVPINPVREVTIKPSGKHVVVQTDFGLIVRYDGNHHMDIKVPSDYADELCGLCGDYNGSPSDDFRTPEGKLVKGVNDFGNSWNVDDNCTKTDSDVDPECTEEETDKYEGPAYCGILVDPFGPFAACHYKIDPMSFFNDCVYDMCELDGSKTELCDALEAYVNECQQRNITIDSWRNSTFCPLTCPPNSHYEPCTSACPATCLNPTPPSCDLPCVEGCQCDKGFVLSGDQCVPKKQCGCFYNGTEYQPGEVIWSKACDQVCTCQSSNNIKCKDTSCDPDEYCGSEGGVQGCYPKGSSTCTASGDPHYTSFDKKKFNFHGNCTYVMSQTCNSTQTPFAVYASNEHRNGKKTVSYVKAVYVQVYGITVSILKKKVVQVNDKTVTVPNKPVSGVTIKQNGKHVVVETDFGLIVRYDGNHNAQVKVPNDYSGELCGLCGDYNTNPLDDFKTPTGELVKNVNDFGNSWNVDKNCTSSGSDVEPECSEEETEKYQGPAYCGILVDPFGPFAACHYKISPTSFFNDCVYDMCELDGSKTELCEALEAYVNECQQRNITIDSWRNDTFCPLRCPANSHYDPCASACPATCVNPRPPTCDEPCAEGCECDQGFVQSGDQCVPQQQCGCFYNGDYYQTGDDFFTPDCSKKCECQGSNVTTCSDWQCGEKEYCGLVNGIHGCHPIGFESCYISGDPHYYSFDKRSLAFMGTCTYTLARSCENQTGPWFTVEGKNEERGQKGVSYLKKIYLTTQGSTITLMKSRRTLVNDKRIRLPYQTASKTAISQSGQYVVVQTSFGLTLRWDGNHYLEIIVPTSYFNMMCGLCGNLDGFANNDNIKPDGSAAKTGDELGNSWKTKDDEDDDCKSDDSDQPPCDEDLYEQVISSDSCGRLIDPMGAFRDCIKIVDPMPYFNNCIFDMCQYEGLDAMLCDQLQAYTDACLSAGATVHSWREPDFCPLDCPANSHYTLCASACPPTCNDPFAPGNCPNRCVEGCECDEGYVLSDGKCVPANECGCTDSEGDYYLPNESWYKPGCTEECLCQGHNIFTCKNSSCLPVETCGLEDGIYGCHALDRETCSVSGDPHYTTFDKKVHNFMGTCTYTLSKLGDTSSNLKYYNVETTNEHRGSNKKVSYVKAVHIDVYGHRITLMKSRRVILNGKRINLPVFVDDQVVIRLSGKYAVVETDFGLWVRFDGNHHADVSVPSSYTGLLSGLCGNYNKNKADDNLKPDGSAADNVNDLGESWLVPDDTPGCTNSGGIEDCDDDVQAEAEKPTSCGFIKDPTGLFKECHSKIPPEQYFDNCVYDMCAYDGDTMYLCLALQSYADLCAKAGVSVTWRNKTFCPLTCGLNSHYEPCGTACPASCTDLSAPNDCNKPCVEDCVCDNGFVLSGDKCVPFSQCGCVDTDKNYHLLGENWITDSNCTERCTCSSPNNITCEQWNCGPLETCEVKDGVLGCQILGTVSCHVAGDPHYFTFDSAMHTFMGTCTYTLAEVCVPTMVTPFTVNAKNEERGQPGVSYISSVNIDVYNVRITLQKSRRILVDGKRVRAPVTDQIKGVSIVTSGIYSVVETDFGLVVKFDGNHHLEIKVPSTYFGKLCGMCGNYNQDQSDELLMPDGKMANNVTHFGNSWKDEGDSDPGCKPDNREDLNASCLPSDMEKVVVLCQDMLNDKYKTCHSLVDPFPFIQNCVFDMCEYNGMISTLCDNIHSYVEACKSEGVGIKWRNSTFCPLACPPNSHYVECSTPCPATCTDIYAPSNCETSSACVEGCECNAGYVLSDNECVKLQECGCVDAENEYHNVGESWLTKDCQETCHCPGDGNVKCEAFSCGKATVCDAKDGVNYCRPTRFNQCHISGDPHYITYDFVIHHYQGKDTYTLSETNNAGNLIPFNIEGRNKRRSPFSKVSFLQEVYIDIHGYSIMLLKNRKVVVDGVRIKPPFEPREGLRIYQKSRSIFLEMDFGLTVEFDGESAAVITLPSTYMERVLGLCGNYDDRRYNDYMKPDGTITENLNEFGNSWKVRPRNRAATETQTQRIHKRDVNNPESGFTTEDCTSDQLELMNSTKFCGALSNPNGPFKACHSIVSPSTFQENCLFDLCADFESKELLCLSFEAYTKICQEKLVPLDLWREQTECGLDCPAHSTYRSCMIACPATCADLAAPGGCEIPCQEGCECDRGYVLSDLECVPFSQCGCTYHSKYYEVQETFVTDQCDQSCLCANTNTVQCQPKQCGTGEVCAAFNLTIDCFQEGACLSDPCLSGGTCSESPGIKNYTCECRPGFFGEMCENQLDEETSGPNVVLIVVLVVLATFLVSLCIGFTIYFLTSRRNPKAVMPEDFAMILPENVRRKSNSSTSSDSVDSERL
eukprot:gi/632986747/ref/XP_007910409.1/ PREDICTED: IgGFc-binding protein-like [Callorhinchus milii]